MGNWGYPNGQIPITAMVPMESRGETFWLEPSAQLWWLRLASEFKRAWGVDLDITDGYRDLARQQYYWDLYQSGQGNIAARPGTSNHGWGQAVDIYTPAYGSSSSPQHAWLREWAPKFGWTWDTGRASGESWHWEFAAVPTIAWENVEPVSTVFEEDDMAINDGGYIAEQDSKGNFLRGAIFGPGVPDGVLVVDLRTNKQATIADLQAMGNLAGVRVFKNDDGYGKRVGAPIKYVGTAEFDATVKLAKKIYGA